MANMLYLEQTTHNYTMLYKPSGTYFAVLKNIDLNMVFGPYCLTLKYNIRKLNIQHAVSSARKILHVVLQYCA